MKKAIILTMVILFVIALLCACEPETPNVSSSSAPASSNNDTTPTTPPSDVTVGTVSDYVKTAKEATQNFESGSVTYRLPEILLNSSDADAANQEIMSRFGEYCTTNDTYSPVIMLDYEAFLSDKYLSVLVTGKFDGGNSYGLCYCFDVTTGSELNNDTLCSMTGRDYNTAIDTLTANLTTEYDSRYENLPGNDTERSKTLNASNIEASRMHLDESGRLMAMVEIYAAVGGGHWVDTFPAE